MYRVGLVVLLSIFCMPALSYAQGVYLGDLSWPEAERRFAESPVVILPFGAGAKEHGPHMPMNADRIVMDHLIDAAVQTRNIIVAPPVVHGWFPAFRTFPGTEVSDPTVFQNYMFEIGMSLARSGAQRILFLNTGIAKATGLPIAIAAREIRQQTGVPTLVVSWGDLETEELEALAQQREGGHGDEMETSINLYLQPELVNMELAVQDYGNRTPKDYGGYQPGVITRNQDDPAYSETGIYGDATLASAEKGQRAIEILTEELLRAIDGFSKVPLRKGQ